MITIKLDTTGSFNVIWPRKYSDIVQLGEAYVAYEGALPVEEQLQDVSLALIQSALDAAQVAIAAAHSGESSRAMASETVRQSFEAARPLLEKAIARLKGTYYDNLAQLEEWGLDTVVGTTGVSVRKPRSQKQWLAFLDAYIVKEGSLPPEQRITDPVLAAMLAHQQTIQDALAARTSGRDLREINIQVRNTAVHWLLNLLQVTAVARVAVTHNGFVTNDLQLWGYEVIGTAVDNGEEPPPPEA